VIKETNYGYACINMQLSQPVLYGAKPKKTEPITTNRTMIKSTFERRGLRYASELALQNVKDLYKILVWNKQNFIYFYRLSSDIFPWASEYQFEQLPDHDEIVSWMTKAGQYANASNIRLTSHPGPFNKLASSDERVIRQTVRDLEIHGWVQDKLLMPRTPWSKINIHVGATYGDKAKAAESFCRNFELLSDAVKTRLTVENDDKPSLFSTSDLNQMISSKINIPIVFDYHHHSLHDGGVPEAEALQMAASTWGNIKPVVHYSESRSIEQKNPKIKPQAHSDYINLLPNNHGVRYDCMIEAKMKELALMRAIRLYESQTNAA